MNGKGDSESLLKAIKEIAPLVFENMQITANENEKEKSEFSSEFKEKYHQILEFAKENNLLLYAHGTASNKVANLISKTGLKYKQPELGATAFAMGIFEEEDYKKMLNWPHFHHTDFVLLGIPRETKKYWREEKQIYDEDDEWGEYSTKYVIPPEFIIGTIDAMTETIEENPTFSLTHNTEDLIQDMAANTISSRIEGSNESVLTSDYEIDYDIKHYARFLLETCNDLIRSLNSEIGIIEDGRGVIHGKRDEPFQKIIEGHIGDYRAFMQKLAEIEYSEKDDKSVDMHTYVMSAIDEKATLSGVNAETRYVTEQVRTEELTHDDVRNARDEEWD